MGGGGYLVDTNVISEESKPKPNPEVMEWIAGVNPRRLYLSVLVFGEARRGVEKMPEGRKKNALRVWLEKWEGWPSAQILPVTLDIAQQWGAIAVHDERLQGVDGLIAATALVHEMVVVTHNIRHFRNIPGLEIANPWRESD